MNTSMQRPSDRFMPLLFVAAPLLFIFSLLVWLVWLSVHNYPGEVTTAAYEKGLRYNEIIEKAKLQEKLGWQSAVTFETEGNEAIVSFRLSDKDGKAIKKAVVYAWFVRATQEGHDMKIPLVSDGKGYYSGKAKLEWKGEWEVYISATADGHNYQKETITYLR